MGFKFWSKENHLPTNIITTNYGQIIGRKLIFESGCPCDAFLGIPYAKPPLKELRFQVIFFKLFFYKLNKNHFLETAKSGTVGRNSFS